MKQYTGTEESAEQRPNDTEGGADRASEPHTATERGAEQERRARV